MVVLAFLLGHILHQFQQHLSYHYQYRIDNQAGYNATDVMLLVPVKARKAALASDVPPECLPPHRLSAARQSRPSCG